MLAGVRSAVAVTPVQLPEVLLHVAVVRPVFLWGAPGVGKSSLVREFAESLGLECVTLLGTQLAPEDLIGVPELVNGRSRFAPPESIARDEPYCLFLDERNAPSPEVRKAFYSLILDGRIGSYELPEGSVVIGAANRVTDNALARPMASALVNRMVHVHLAASPKDWPAWAAAAPRRTGRERVRELLARATGHVHRRHGRTRQAGGEQERGLLPLGLVEEIRALEQPPLDWDARLALWFEEHVPSVERRRTYARASRRQSATPHIPRPGRLRPEEVERRVTFGVVLDASGSMDPEVLGKALGAVASYALARDVPAARVVFRDAVAYDAGYVRVEDIAGRVRVRGRGGTVLQPGVDVLERAARFSG